MTRGRWRTNARNRRIAVQTAETLVIESKAAYETAVMSEKEYLEGTYLQERKTYENAIFVAEESLKKAELAHDSIKRSVARGLISPLQLQGEQFRVDAARKELELARQKLHVLDNYTKEKMLTQLSSDIEATKIKWENEQASYQEELNKLKEIEEQIALCTVTAPQDGQVVYANVMSSRSSSEFVVEAGAAVRERQEIIRLPDPKNMQVKSDVNESRINLIEEGMKAEIRIDALGDELFDGVVTKVNKYAEPGNWWSSTAKEYATEIKILDPPPQIRAGLTAEVRIHVEQLDDVLQVPVQAILEHEGQTFCLVKQGDSYRDPPRHDRFQQRQSGGVGRVVSGRLAAAGPGRAQSAAVPRVVRLFRLPAARSVLDCRSVDPPSVSAAEPVAADVPAQEIAAAPEGGVAAESIRPDDGSAAPVSTPEKGG